MRQKEDFMKRMLKEAKIMVEQIRETQEEIESLEESGRCERTMKAALASRNFTELGRRDISGHYLTFCVYFIRYNKRSE